MNSICDASLQTGFAIHSPEVTIAIVDEVAKDLDLRRLVPRGLEPLEPMEPVLVGPAPPVLRQTNGHAADLMDGVSNGNGYHSTASRVPPPKPGAAPKTGCRWRAMPAGRRALASSPS